MTEQEKKRKLIEALKTIDGLKKVIKEVLDADKAA